MSVYFLDLDGVICKFATQELNDGAKKFLQQLKSNGHQIIFTTARKIINNNVEALNIPNTIQMLKKEGIEYDRIIQNVHRHRVVINDEGVQAVNFTRNDKFSDEYIFKIIKKNKIIQRTYDTLASIAWTAKQYGWADMDDYIQTLLIGDSLIANRGFNHRDLVKRYRIRPGHIVEGNTLNESGAFSQGQIRKLLNGFSLDYADECGTADSDGSAMKVACIVPFYLENFKNLVEYTDKITIITHNSIDCRLSALLIVLRFRQVFLEEDVDNPDILKKSLIRAMDILNINEGSNCFIAKLDTAIEITKEIKTPSWLLKKLNEKIGITNFANSAPITACMWSFRANK